jgi:hypothetical protein
MPFIPMLARYPAYLIFLPHITLIISGEVYSEEKVQLTVVMDTGAKQCKKKQIRTLEFLNYISVPVKSTISIVIYHADIPEFYI